MKELMKKLIIIILLFPSIISIQAMKQKFDIFYREKIKKTKTTTPSYCPCTAHHSMSYNSAEIIHLLHTFHLPTVKEPRVKESKEAILLGKLLDQHVSQQIQVIDHNRRVKQAEKHIKTLNTQFFTYQTHKNTPCT